MVDGLLKRYGVGWALTLLVLELTYINTKSLLYLVQGMTALDTLFGVVGGVAFSMVTVLVMRLSRRGWLKFVFPLFDVMLVLLGFNLRFADELLGNPVRFWLTVFIALFTGLITYSLGHINAEQQDDEVRASDQRRIEELIQKLGQRERSLAEVQAKYNDTLSRLNDTQQLLSVTKSELSETVARLSDTERTLNDTRAELAESKSRLSVLDSLQNRNEYLENVSRELLRSHILYEAWLATKRRNSSKRDQEILRLAERVRNGVTVALEDYERVTAD